MDNIKKIELIFEILKDTKIYDFSDLVDKPLTHNRLFSAQNYPWIAEVAEIINSLYYTTEAHIGNTDGQIFLVDEIKESGCQDILKYSCIFPDRMIISSGEFHYLNNPQFALVDIDFFRKLFWAQELLLNGIVHISPFYRCCDLVDGEGNKDNAMLEYLTLPDQNMKKIAQLDRSGIGGVEHIPFVDKVFVALPWLQNACIQDYLDIINSNQTEFIFFNHYLAKLSQLTENSNEYLKKFVQDFNEAAINIQIALEKKKSELKAKGLATAISVCLTAIPMLLPDKIPQTLPIILGGGTVNQFVNQLSLVQDIRSIGKDNPFWVLWKWKVSAK